MYMSLGLSVVYAVVFILFAGMGELELSALILVGVIIHLFMGVEAVIWEQKYVAARPVPVHG